MAQPNIVLARIDNRLVHGQVGNSWVGASKANLIVVADDEVVNDDIQKSLMKMTADSSGVGIRFFSIQKTIDIIFKASPKQQIFIVCKTPSEMLKLIKGGVPIKKVNVGNMHVKPGKHVLHEAHVYVDDQDMKDFEAMKSMGVEVYIEILPGDKKYKI
ncbi:MAG: PTS N-acetylgalactosamine transporter subunit IIB [Erysipelotrichaceae bacterium]|nr:PTS N-acetylgalactosamine transporter subunit IIB [Erysipelotrichaceae bacterium]